MAEAVSPRLQPLPESEWDDLLRLVVEDSPGGVERPPNVFTTLARAPEVFRGFVGFGAALRNGRLPARTRELVILRTAQHARSDYEWTHHVPMARAAGVAEDEIEQLRQPLDDGKWPEDERAVLAAADELWADGTISDKTWAALAGRLEDAQLIELVMLAGEYRLLAAALSALRIQLEEEQ